MSNSVPSRAVPVVSFLLAEGAHHKKPHSPTSPMLQEKDGNKGAIFYTLWFIYRLLMMWLGLLNILVPEADI